MAHSTDEVRLKVDIPKFPKPDAPGGGWGLHTDTVENWAWIDSIFTPVELNAIINIGNSIELQRASTFGPTNLEVRDSFVTFLFPNEVTSWIFQRLTAAVNDINSRFFGFDLTAMEQGLQFTRYQAPGEHYEWHIDRGMLTGTRKLSLSLQLSDPSEYDGGELEMWYGGEPVKASKKRGMITMFPSYVMHRVSPVTKGTRYSLVCWVSGPQFK